MHACGGDPVGEETLLFIRAIKEKRHEKKVHAKCIEKSLCSSQWESQPARIPERALSDGRPPPRAPK